jgi:hypothetical protein
MFYIAPNGLIKLPLTTERFFVPSVIETQAYSIFLKRPNPLTYCWQ